MPSKEIKHDDLNNLYRKITAQKLGNLAEQITMLEVKIAGQNQRISDLETINGNLTTGMDDLEKENIALRDQLNKLINPNDHTSGSV